MGEPNVPRSVRKFISSVWRLDQQSTVLQLVTGTCYPSSGRKWKELRWKSVPHGCNGDICQFVAKCPAEFVEETIRCMEDPVMKGLARDFQDKPLKKTKKDKLAAETLVAAKNNALTLVAADSDADAGHSAEADDAAGAYGDAECMEEEDPLDDPFSREGGGDQVVDGSEALAGLMIRNGYEETCRVARILVSQRLQHRDALTEEQRGHLDQEILLLRHQLLEWSGAARQVENTMKRIAQVD
jgi:hypothetical protein